MNYSVLARKWRPTSLQDVVGQKHILTIMSNSLRLDKLHHAYLFSGPAGVGKTTLARIFAKCLNCMEGISATPCGQCTACQQIDAGCFPDLIEIDAASRTKVEDTRDLLDNVQYAPTLGRYKIYLIDEVHMLSNHSFNALLKTLEEPPAHVKFLLATTDPQKLPVTVLSRCLKLQLGKLELTDISAYLATVLREENIAFEEPALQEIAKASQGSMRDALSLLDQAIVYGDVTHQNCCEMLGTAHYRLCSDLLDAIVQKQSDTVFALIEEMASKGYSFKNMVDNLLELLHQWAMQAKRLAPEDIQLLYQITLKGKQDLPWAPTAKIGFEMLVLRLMYFYPLGSAQPIAQAVESKPISQAAPPSTWEEILPRLSLTGVTQMIAKQSSVAKLSNSELELRVSSKHQSLCNDKQKQLLQAAVQATTGKALKVSFSFGEHTHPTVHDRQEEKKTVEHARVSKDPNIQAMMSLFDATITDTLTDTTDEH